jgi:hypothetical protein
MAVFIDDAKLAKGFDAFAGLGAGDLDDPAVHIAR